MSSPAMTQASGAPLVTLTTTAETAALTCTALPINAPGAQGMQVMATVTGATGASVTSCQVRVRQGSGVGGAVVGGVFQESQGASSFYAMSVTVLDPSPPNPAVYTVTVQQVGATGNGTVTLANMGLEVATATGA